MKLRRFLIGLSVFFLILSAESSAGTLPSCNTPFIRGDANNTGALDLSDPVYTLHYLFLTGTAAPVCLDTADSNNDNTVNIGDALYTLEYLFMGGPAPVAPFPNPGFESASPVQSVLDCQGSPCPWIHNNKLIWLTVARNSAQDNQDDWYVQAWDGDTGKQISWFKLLAVYGPDISEFMLEYERPNPLAGQAVIAHTTAQDVSATVYNQDTGDLVRMDESTMFLADAGFSAEAGSAPVPDPYLNIFGDEETDLEPNGCSGVMNVAGPIPLPGTESECITACCNQHDLCYRVGGSAQRKSECDAQLRACIRGCTSWWEKVLFGPARVIFIYPVAIGLFGKLAFNYTVAPCLCQVTMDVSIPKEYMKRAVFKEDCMGSAKDPLHPPRFGDPSGWQCTPYCTINYYSGQTGSGGTQSYYTGTYRCVLNP